ncbi:MAG TPA: type IV pilus twitching motility protein PilT [Solirubrobacterales bacterium]
MSIDFSEVLRRMVEARASDVHITAGVPPAIREKGKIAHMEGFPVLSGQDTREIVYGILNEDQRKRFENNKQLDFAYAIPGVARFRVNCFFQRGSVSAAFRLIPQEIPHLDSLGVPQVLRELTQKPRGFVLVTGPTGSGKSTTLAAMLDVINSERPDHILTIEDPIEFLHEHKKSIVNQREVGSDAPDFALGLRAALREDPDDILVGEMRDLETMATALTAAETGHLVFATLHTQSTSQTVDRIIDVFPPAQQGQVRSQLSIALQGIVTQQLLSTLDGMGRTVACEVLVPTPAVRNLIREGKTHQIYAALQTSGAVGMQTMDADLVRLVREGKISRSLAEGRSAVPEELKRLLGAQAAAMPGSTAKEKVDTTPAPPPPARSAPPPPGNGPPPPPGNGAPPPPAAGANGSPPPLPPAAASPPPPEPEPVKETVPPPAPAAEEEVAVPPVDANELPAEEPQETFEPEATPPAPGPPPAPASPPAPVNAPPAMAPPAEPAVPAFQQTSVPPPPPPPAPEQ